MKEVTSTWVARNWAAAANLALREPVLVRHHGRSSVMIMDEQVARDFLVWFSGQRGPTPAPAQIDQAPDGLRAEADHALVKVLEAKFGVRWPRTWTEAHLSIAIGEVPVDRNALHSIADEYADVEIPWWYKP